MEKQIPHKENRQPLQLVSDRLSVEKESPAGEARDTQEILCLSRRIAKHQEISPPNYFCPTA